MASRGRPDQPPQPAAEPGRQPAPCFHPTLTAIRAAAKAQAGAKPVLPADRLPGTFQHGFATAAGQRADVRPLPPATRCSAGGGAASTRTAGLPPQPLPVVRFQTATGPPPLPPTARAAVPAPGYHAACPHDRSRGRHACITSIQARWCVSVAFHCAATHRSWVISRHPSDPTQGESGRADRGRRRSPPPPSSGSAWQPPPSPPGRPRATAPVG
jgi:hypothetical protein